jgi:hypothetical protein
LARLFRDDIASSAIEIPPDVIETRQQFVRAKENYFSNEVYWDAKLRHFIDFIQQELAQQDELSVLQRLQETPGEIFLSFLEKRMHLSLLRLKDTAVFPKDGSTFSVVVSKYEGGIWPLKIMLSMEIEIKCTAQRFSLAISRLRRGSQDITLGLAWAYFGPELESLRSLETGSKQIILLTTKDK